MPNTYKYIEVTAVEKELMFKDSPYVGSYTNVFKTWYNKQTTTFTLTDEGLFTPGSTTGKQLIADENDPNHFTTSSSSEHVYLYDDRFILYSSGSAGGNTFVVGKENVTGSIDMSSRDKTNSVAISENSKTIGELMHITFGEEVIDVYYDYVENKVYWEVETILISGTSGLILNDIVGVKVDNEYIIAFQITNEETYASNGFQAKASKYTEQEEKTYTGELGELKFDKYGAATLAGEDVVTSQEDEKLVLTKGKTTYKVTLDEEAGTYEVVYNGETDDFSAVVNKWVCESDAAAGDNPVTLTIDETGKATLNATGDTVDVKWQNVEFQFVTRSGNVYTFNHETYGDLVVTLNESEETVTFVYEQGGATGETVYSLEKFSLEDLVGLKFSNDDFPLSITFTDSENCNVYFYNSDRNATYTVSEEQKTITVKLSEGTLTLTLQDDGSFIITNAVCTGYQGEMYGFSRYDIEDLVLTLVD